MPANIEIKARVEDLESLQVIAEQISDTPCQVIPQEDTFFNCPDGRLKLRELGPDHGQLIYYQRQDTSGPKHSEYKIYNTENPAGVKAILAEAFGIRGVVNKQRYLYLAGQTRIHLDDVQGLGRFMELEVVLAPGQTDAEGQAIARDLMERLGIAEKDLIDIAYMDMLEKRIRAQCIVNRGDRILMAKHRLDGMEWWCLPGGGVEPGETAAQAAIRELKEECGVIGRLVRQTSHTIDEAGVEITFLMDIGNQEPNMGTDPEFEKGNQILVDLRWMRLAEIPERDRVYLWAAGLVSIPQFSDEITRWGDELSYPRR